MQTSWVDRLAAGSDARVVQATHGNGYTEAHGDAEADDEEFILDSDEFPDSDSDSDTEHHVPDPKTLFEAVAEFLRQMPDRSAALSLVCSRVLYLAPGARDMIMRYGGPRRWLAQWADLEVASIPAAGPRKEPTVRLRPSSTDAVAYSGPADSRYIAELLVGFVRSYGGRVHASILREFYHGLTPEQDHLLHGRGIGRFVSDHSDLLLLRSLGPKNGAYEIELAGLAGAASQPAPSRQPASPPARSSAISASRPKDEAGASSLEVARLLVSYVKAHGSVPQHAFADFLRGLSSEQARLVNTRGIRRIIEQHPSLLRLTLRNDCGSFVVELPDADSQSQQQPMPPPPQAPAERHMANAVSPRLGIARVSSRERSLTIAQRLAEFLVASGGRVHGPGLPLFYREWLNQTQVTYLRQTRGLKQFIDDHRDLFRLESYGEKKGESQIVLVSAKLVEAEAPRCETPSREAPPPPIAPGCAAPGAPAAPPVAAPGGADSLGGLRQLLDECNLSGDANAASALAWCGEMGFDHVDEIVKTGMGDEFAAALKLKPGKKKLVLLTMDEHCAARASSRPAH